MSQQPPYQPPPPQPGPPQYQGPPPGYPPPSGGGGLTPNLARALCYVWLVGVIFLLIDPYKNDPEVRFNAWQSLVLWGAALILNIVIGFIPVVRGIGGLIQLVALIAAIVAAVKAYQGGRQVLPVVGPIAAQQAGVSV